MGGFCCCPCAEDFEDYGHPSNPVYRHCICLRYFFHQLFSGFNTAFQRLDSRTVASSIQTATPSLGTTAADSSSSETYHLVPRPPPYDTDPRYSRSQRDGLVLRREKSMSHIQEDSQTVRRNVSSSGLEHLASLKKRNSLGSDEEYKASRSDVDRSQPTKAYGSGYVITSSEDEDVCPTCLDEYTPENPKIVAKCSHHFHLSCIYEWMERSDNCPICGKDMEFCESP